jgi:hypothetical protein
MTISSMKTYHIVYLEAADVQQQEIVSSQQPHIAHS